MDEGRHVEVTVLDSTAKHTYVYCGTCSKHNQKVDILASVRKHEQHNIDDRVVVDFWETSQVVKCGGCETVFFRIVRSNSEDVDYRHGYRGDLVAFYNEEVEILPEIVDERKAISDFHLLPSQLQAIYIEASKALSSGQPILTGIGIRAILESICKDKEAPGDNLLKKIDGLKNQGFLSDKGAVILHKLRVLGNKSAHEVQPQSADQLALAFDVLDNLLTNVYVLEPRIAQVFSEGE